MSNQELSTLDFVCRLNTVQLFNNLTIEDIVSLILVCSGVSVVARKHVSQHCTFKVCEIILK